MQRHAPALSLAVQIAFCPQGDGLQGSTGAGAGAGINIYINIILRHLPKNLRVVTLTQPTKASPVYPGSQLHWAIWLVTRQVAW